MEITIRSPRLQDYGRFSDIMDEVQMLHVDWRPDIYKPASPLITKEMFEEILKGDSWYVAEADGRVVGVLELIKRTAGNFGNGGGRGVGAGVHLSCPCVSGTGGISL